MQLVCLDQVLGVSSGAIKLFVERFRQARQVGDDEAAVGPLGSGLDAGDNASLDRPAFGGVTKVAIAADLFSFAVEAIERGVLGERNELAQHQRHLGSVRRLPGKRKADIPRHPAGIVENFCLQPITERLKMLPPKFIRRTRQTIQAFGPIAIKTVDTAATILTDDTGKPVDLHMVITALGGRGNQVLDKFHDLLRRLIRRLMEFCYQSFFLRLLHFHAAERFAGLGCFEFGHMAPYIGRGKHSSLRAGLQCHFSLLQVSARRLCGRTARQCADEPGSYIDLRQAAVARWPRLD